MDLIGKRVALLVSGGLDSTILYYYLKDHKSCCVIPIYYDYKGKYCSKERGIVMNLIPNVIIDESFNFSEIEEPSSYIPNRNLYILSHATRYANIVMFGGLKDDNVGDKSAKFCNMLSRLLTVSMGRSIYVNSPFFEFEKAEIIKWFTSNYNINVAQKVLLGTTSCYHSEKMYCGECSSCYRKMCAFLNNGIKLPFHNLMLAQHYYTNRHKYSKIRQDSIVMASEYLKVGDWVEL